MEKIKMYLSLAETRLPGVPRIPTQAEKLISLLRNEDIDLVYICPDDFNGYEQIEATIEQCDCLLAIVDIYWTSST